MSKRKKILLMLAKGGVSQAGVAAALHASKRDVSACAKAIRERGLTFDDVAAMGAAESESESTPIPFTPLRRIQGGALPMPRLELRRAEVPRRRVDPDPVAESLDVDWLH